MYVIYAKSSGEILREVQCSSDAIGYQVGLDEEYTVGAGNWLTHRVIDGKVVALEAPRRPPNDWEVFDFFEGKYIDPRTPETEWPLVRAERDRRLLACDWTQLPDVPLSTKEAWAVYRQALRDITLQPDPFNIVWPAAPTQG